MPLDAERIAARADDALAGAGVRVARRRARRPTMSRPSAGGPAPPRGWWSMADAQTAGRGRLGRSWHSPPGENLYLLDAAAAGAPAVEIPPLTLLAGAAVARGARAARPEAAAQVAERRAAACARQTAVRRGRQEDRRHPHRDGERGRARRARRGRHRPQRQRHRAPARACRARDVAGAGDRARRSTASELLAAVLVGARAALRRLRAARAGGGGAALASRTARSGTRCRVRRPGDATISRGSPGRRPRRRPARRRTMTGRFTA